MSRLSIFLVPAAVAFATACSSEPRPAYAPTQTTGAAYPDGPSAKLERERNEALTALSAEQAARQRERDLAADEAKSLSEHDALELRALTAIESADIQLDGLSKKRLNTGEAKARKALEDTIADVKTYKSKLYAELKKLHGAGPDVTRDLRQEIDATIFQLEHALGSERDQSNTPGSKTGVTKPRDEKAPSTPPIDTPPVQDGVPREGTHPMPLK